MTSVRDLLAALTRTDPAHPRLTWYGPGGERLDLSGRVLGNWVTKACNLLVEEADAGPGTRVVLDLPAHWRTVVWALAAWTCGADVVLPAGEVEVVPPADGSERPLPRDLEGAVVVTDRPESTGASASSAPDLVIAVALPALALRFPGTLPAGVLDGAADLMTYPDALGWLPALDDAAPALDGGPAHGDLLSWAWADVGADGWPPSPRVLTAAAEPRHVLAVALAAWQESGSIVLQGQSDRHPSALATQERVTVRD